MRQALQRKLRSQRGASMLLALLFLVLCTMVAASILMAAVANAGKHRSNLEQHQQYLALSSAVSMLCDELNQAQYLGQYNYWEEEIPIETENPEEPEFRTEKNFKQIKGSYDSDLWFMLCNDFDNLFKKEAENRLNGSGIINRTDSIPAATFTHTLTLSPDTDVDALDADVAVTLRVADSYAIYLTATLDGYTMEAELTPIATSVPTLPASMTPKESNEVQQTAPMKWKIGWITTGQEEEEETP